MFPPLLDVTTLTDRKTTAKWPLLWHLQHFVPLAGNLVCVSDYIWNMAEPLGHPWNIAEPSGKWLNHLEHGWTAGASLVFLSQAIWTCLLAKFGFPFFQCISTKFWVSDWPRTWDLKAWTGGVRLESRYPDLHLISSDNTSVSYLLIFLFFKFAMSCQFVEISNKGLYCFSFLLNAAMKTSSLTNNIPLRYKMFFKFLNNLSVFLLIAFPKCKSFKYLFCLFPDCIYKGI